MGLYALLSVGIDSYSPRASDVTRLICGSIVSTSLAHDDRHINWVGLVPERGTHPFFKRNLGAFKRKWDKFTSPERTEFLNLHKEKALELTEVLYC